MWFVYRFARLDALLSEREFEHSVAAFCADVCAHFDGNALSVAATARPKGSIEVWYRLPRRPDADTFWQQRLHAAALTALRVPARG